MMMCVIDSHSGIAVCFVTFVCMFVWWFCFLKIEKRKQRKLLSVFVLLKQQQHHHCY